MLSSNNIIFLLFLFSRVICCAQVTVSGVVLDQDGTKLPGALVTAVPIDHGFAGSLGWVAADENAIFHLTLRQGRYEIRAKDEAKDYPDPSFLFCADPAAVFPEVDVSDQDMSGVQVRLGQKGAVLEGGVYDVATSRPVPKAKMSLCEADNPQVCVDVFTDERGRFRFTVPIKAMLINFSLAGYKTLRYEGGSQVTLSPGEDRQITAELQSQ